MFPFLLEFEGKKKSKRKEREREREREVRSGQLRFGLDVLLPAKVFFLSSSLFDSVIRYLRPSFLYD